MNATKRKFNALLQGIGSSPQPASPGPTSPATKVKLAEHESLLQKRRRLGFPESTAPSLHSVSLGIPTFGTSSPKSKISVSGKPRESTLSRYSPGDRDDLLKRLATFQEITDWTPKPDRVNEVEWAKRGWVCQGKERVRCLLCHRELVVNLNRKAVAGKEETIQASSEIEDALVSKYEDLIVSSHQEECLWRRRGCDDSLLRLSFSSTKTVLEALRQRYDELCTRQHFLPYEFNLRLPEGLNLDEVLSQLPPDFFNNQNSKGDSDQASDKPPNRAALALALMGWQGLTHARIGAVPNSASCHTCQRRLGLWMFKSKEVDEQGQVVVPAPMDHLDPVREHRFFCPWKTVAAQNREGAKPNDSTNMAAWQLILQTITNDASLRKVYEGRSSKSILKRSENGSGHARTQSVPDPVTPVRSGTVKNTSGTPHFNNEQAGSDVDEAERTAKDKERWARLRKVKSLFDTKKLRRSMSRPGTPHSVKSVRGET